MCSQKPSLRGAGVEPFGDLSTAATAQVQATSPSHVRCSHRKENRFLMSLPRSVGDVSLIVGVLLEVVVVGEVVGSHVQGAKPGVVGQRERQRGREAALVAVLVEELAHGSERGGVARDRLGDGCIESGCAVGVEQAQESAGEHAEVVAARGGGAKQRSGRGCGDVQAVLGAVGARGALGGDEGLDVAGVFDLLAVVERTRMVGDDGVGVEDAHALEGGGDDEGARGAVVGHGVVVFVEAYVGGDGPTDGLGAMVTAWTAACEAAATGRKLSETPLIKEVEDYNEVNCKVMMEIVRYLRENHWRRSQRLRTYAAGRGAHHIVGWCHAVG